MLLGNLRHIFAFIITITMIISTHTNEQNLNITELHQITSDAFEVKRYRPGYKEKSFELRNSYYFDSLVKAEKFYSILKNSQSITV